MKTLLAQAERLDNGEVIEGYYAKGLTRDKERNIIDTNLIGVIEINPETLKYKVGEQWLTVDEIEFCVKDVAKRKAEIDTLVEAQSCENCKYSLSSGRGIDYRDCKIQTKVENKNFYCSKFEPKDKA